MPDDHDRSIQFRDGWLAHRNAVPLAHNPYNKQTQPASHKLWDAGWHARQEMRSWPEAMGTWDRTFREFS